APKPPPPRPPPPRPPPPRPPPPRPPPPRPPPPRPPPPPGPPPRLGPPIAWAKAAALVRTRTAPASRPSPHSRPISPKTRERIFMRKVMVCLLERRPTRRRPCLAAR